MDITTRNSDLRCVRCGYSLVGIGDDVVCPECATAVAASRDADRAVLGLASSYRVVAAAWWGLGLSNLIEPILAAAALVYHWQSRGGGGPVALSIALIAVLLCRLIAVSMLIRDGWSAGRRGACVIAAICTGLRIGVIALLLARTWPPMPAQMAVFLFVALQRQDVVRQIFMLSSIARVLDEKWAGHINAAVVVGSVAAIVGLPLSCLGALLGWAGPVILIYGLIGLVVSSGIIGMGLFSAAKEFLRMHPAARAARGESIATR